MKPSNPKADDKDIYSNNYSFHSNINQRNHNSYAFLNTQRPYTSNSNAPHPQSIIMNLSECQYEVVRNVGKHVFHFAISKEKGTLNWDIKWYDSYIDPGVLTLMKPYQKINHFPGMSEITKKNLLAKNLMNMRKLFPIEYNFFPKTWVLPIEANKFASDFEEGQFYILKPEALSQGKGIYIVGNPDQVKTKDKYIAQQYIKDPYLIDGLKFDLRIYVLVYGCDPMRIFLFSDGFARFATDKYDSPSTHNCKNQYQHLTNYAINKKSIKFQFNQKSDEAYTGHKRCLNAIWNYINAHKGDSKPIQQKIEDIIIKTLCVVQPRISHLYKSGKVNDFDNSCCFEILGFDILIDSSLNPILLEVNHSPSFSIDTPFDNKIKTDLISNVFNIVNLSSDVKQQYINSSAYYSMSHPLRANPSSEDKAKLKQERIERRIKFENEHLGKFKVIYPCNEAKYSTFMFEANQLWQQFTGVRRQAFLDRANSLCKQSTFDYRNKNEMVYKAYRNERLFTAPILLQPKINSIKRINNRIISASNYYKAKICSSKPPKQNVSFLFKQKSVTFDNSKLQKQK